jgi:hypothetical protein
VRVTRNYREFVIGLIGLGLIMGLFLLQAANDWSGDPDDCFDNPKGNGCYCEAITRFAFANSDVRLHPGMFAQPVNTWSNVGFILVGLFMLWWIGWERATKNESAHPNRFTRGSFYPALFGGVAIFMGPGSMYFHASLRSWTGWLDNFSMNLFMGFIVIYNVVRVLNLGIGWFIPLYIALVGGLGIAAAIDIEDSQLFFTVLGGVAFCSQVVVYWSRIRTALFGQWWFAAGAGCFVTAYILWKMSWTNGPLCWPDSIVQFHGIWHLLVAAAVFCLYTYWRAEDENATLQPWMLATMRIAFGIMVGAIVPGALAYLLMDQVIEADTWATILVAAVCAVCGAVYSAIAFNSGIYKRGGVLAVLGYVLDISWSLINSIGGLFVWAGIFCKLAGAKFVPPSPESRRSGTFVFDKNPRGEYQATTIGTVIAGGWSTHEEVHVWQARIFGPAYFATYVSAFILNLICRVIMLRFRNIVDEAYRRIFWEDWAYMAGKVSDGSTSVNWGGWTGGLLIALLYVGLVTAIPLGFALDLTVLWIVGIVGLCLYTLIRALMKAGAED